MDPVSRCQFIFICAARARINSRTLDSEPKAQKALWILVLDHSSSCTITYGGEYSQAKPRDLVPA
jgi:hypothetical protein